jgi:ABC-2 type transport system permease protein
MLAIFSQINSISDLFAFIGQWSVLNHFDRMMEGAVDTKDLVFFFSVIIFFLYATVRSLESRKWS